MRLKLIAAGVFILFVSVAWTYFQTPNPPVPGLVRPQIDQSMFDASAAANPAADAAKKRAEARKERLEQRKTTRAGGAAKKEEEKEKPGFLSRLLGKSDTKAAVEEDDEEKPARKVGSPSRMQRRDSGSSALTKSKRDQLAKRREERKARREAMAGAGRANTIHKAGNSPNAGANGGEDEIPLPDEHIPPDEPPDFGAPDLQEDMPPEE